MPQPPLRSALLLTAGFGNRLAPLTEVRAKPAVPVLYESCLPVDAGGVGLDPGDGYAAFLEKPASRAELADALERLLETARREREEATA